LISHSQFKVFGAAAFAAAGIALAQSGANDTVWTKLWTGSNLADWEPKFRGYATGNNLYNTFRLNGDMLEVNYSGYPAGTKYSNANFPFGHLAYKPSKFSFYVLRGEYQVWGNQVSAEGDLAWANQNNGFMLHAQWPMSQSQDFPVSLEAQLLGPASTNSPGTMNLCTPGTQFYNNATGGSPNTAHCINTAATTRAPVNTGWNYVAAQVLGDSLVRHYVGTASNYMEKNVLTYYRPILDNGTKLKEGYITIQAESHPFRFRKIEVANLVGCMNSTSPNYKSYYVRNDASACQVTPIAGKLSGAATGFSFDAGNQRLSLNLPEAFTLRITDLSGKLVWERASKGNQEFDLRQVGPRGVYFLSLVRKTGTFSQKLLLGT
jgi:hypothetical protein